MGPDAILNDLFMRLGAEWDGFAVHPKSFHGGGDTAVSWSTVGRANDILDNLIAEKKAVQ